MYNFFVDNNNISNNSINITGDNYNHIKNVLRMNNDDIIQICNKDTGDSYKAKITQINIDNITCTIIEKLSSNEPSKKITLFQGIPKSDKMEYIIQKSVELGVHSIVPVQMKYCIAKMNNAEKKIKRWNTISEAAAKQSKRNIIPRIENAISIEELCSRLDEYDLVILAYENEQENSIKQELIKHKGAKNIAIIIGPEGGISEEEANVLKEKKAKCVSLGKRILRTETASSAVLSMILYEFEL